MPCVQPAELVQRSRHMNVLVGVDASRDATGGCVIVVIAIPFVSLWMARTAGHGQASDEAPRRASIRSRSTNWLCRWRSAHRADRSDQDTPWSGDSWVRPDKRSATTHSHWR